MRTLRLAAFLLLLCVSAYAASPQVEAQTHDCDDTWTFSSSLEFAPGYWQPGWHTYEFAWSTFEGSDQRQMTFLATADAPLVKGQVQLRFWALVTADGPVTEINPAQDTVMQLSYVSMEDRLYAKNLRASLVLRVRWDGGEWVTVPAGPITKQCAYNNPGLFRRSW